MNRARREWARRFIAIGFESKERESQSAWLYSTGISEATHRFGLIKKVVLKYVQNRSKKIVGYNLAILFDT